MNNLMLYKLISGEEVVGVLKENTDTTIKLDNAVTLVYHQVDEGKMSVGFAPFMPYAAGDVTIQKTAIAAESAPKEQIAQEHTRIFSGIVLAPPGTKFA